MTGLSSLLELENVRIVGSLKTDVECCDLLKNARLPSALHRLSIPREGKPQGSETFKMK